MDQAPSFDRPGGEGDQTRRFKTMLDEHGKHATRIWPLIVIAGILVGLGGGGILFLNRGYASTDTVKAVTADQSETRRQLEQHLRDEAAWRGAVDESRRNMESDWHWVQRRLDQFGQRWGLPSQPLPKHVKEEQ